MKEYLLKVVENNVANGEIVHYAQFFLLPQCFQMAQICKLEMLFAAVASKWKVLKINIYLIYYAFFSFQRVCTETMTDNQSTEVTEDEANPYEFPVTNLYELEGRVFAEHWSIPYKKEESLGKCLIAAARLATAGKIFMYSSFNPFPHINAF